MSTEQKGTWASLSKDIAGLGDLRFPRHAIDLESPADLYLFSDALPQAYGFVACGLQNGTSNILFTKSKVVPWK